MQLKIYKNIQDFYKDTYHTLMRSEAQNMVPLGNVIIGYEGRDKIGWRDPANWFMATVLHENEVQLTAIMTPPHNITLYATDNIINPKAIRCLIDGLQGYEVPGVTTEKTLAEIFAKEYTARYGLTFKTTMNQRIYELKAVNKDIKQIGTVRVLSEKDMYFFPYWAEAFNAANSYGQTEMFIPQDAKEYLYRLSTKNLYVLEVDGVPVSMAGFTRRMPTAIGVAFVYTPPYFREMGYASSCVAQISQIALDEGFSKCVLYTDLLNPTSNSIYQKIGYTLVCDSLMLEFEY